METTAGIPADRPAADPPAAGPPAADPPAEPGERYYLLRELSRGGMGVVYLAEDRETDERCAVKVLHPQLTQDETSVARFQTEVRAACKIEHPAIVKMRPDLGRLADGRTYCVMEYLDGLTLTQLVAQRGPLPLAVILEILVPICEALDLAHMQHVIHRDLKPDNVILTLRADGYVPKLLDFGIAKLLDEPGVTRPGATPGTTAHMAPEQLRGDPVDRRCDVYALGVLTYQMITGGHLPYDAPDRTLYHAQMTQPPIDPRKRCPSVPAYAVGPLLAAIHPDPSQRPASAGAFALALAGVLVGQTPQTDGMGIVQSRAPRLLVATNLQETLRAPGHSGARGSASWSYSYVAPLGKGGFGEVFRGVKHGAPGFALPVAIKRILREYADNPMFVEMFHREARIAALLGEHPNIIKVIDHLTDPDGQLAIVMELVDGVDLEALRQAGPLSYPVIIHIIGEILEGLGHAHHLPLPGVQSSPDEIAARGAVRGVIHRDMSHGNVMVSWYGAIKVMDFGIAKLREATQAPGSALISGKPAYMSPEQATTAVAIDGRSDLFAVGIMLWELMTGQFLFQRDNQQATLAAVLFDRISAPSTLRRDVPADLEAVTMRLLERDLAARYQTAREAYAALMACSAASSRGAKLELQQVMRARFPERAARALLPPPAGSNEPNAPGTAPDSPRALAAWQPEGTTHSHAVGQPAIELAAPRARWRRVAAAAIGVGLCAMVAVAVLMRRHRTDVTSSTPDPAVMMPSATPATPTDRPSAPPTSAALQRPLNANAPSPSSVPTMSTLAIATEPSDAMLRVEDATKLIAAGRSPLTLPVPQGARVRIHAQATGFAPATKTITIGDVDQQAVTLSLAPIARPKLPRSTSAPQSSPEPIAKPAPKPPRPPTKPTDSDDKIME